MTSNLDTPVRILDEADFEAVSGGTGGVHDACVQVALRFLLKQAVTDYLSGEATKGLGPCL
jgi:hypothetical protein